MRPTFDLFTNSPALAVLVCVLSVLGLVAAEFFDSARARAATKLTASSAFVWAALAWGAAQTPFGQLLLVGLVLCWLGDAFLLPLGQTLWFRIGIGAFLLAHLFYAVAMTRLPIVPEALVASFALSGVTAGFVYRWLSPHLPGEFRWPVVAYAGAISLMMALAGATVASGAEPLLGIGAFGFALSDLSVARERFVSAGFVNAAWGLPAYFFSQLAIAYAAGHATIAVG